MKTKSIIFLDKYIKRDYFKSFRDINYYKVFLILITIFLTYYVSKNILEPLNFYDEYKWLDIPMHVLGSFLFANLFLSIVSSRHINFRNILYFILFIGISWEILEYASDIINLKSFVGWIDTFKDLFDDIFGAYLAFIFYKNK